MRAPTTSIEVPKKDYRSAEAGRGPQASEYVMYSTLLQSIILIGPMYSLVPIVYLDIQLGPYSIL